MSELSIAAATSTRSQALTKACHHLRKLVTRGLGACVFLTSLMVSAQTAQIVITPSVPAPNDSVNITVKTSRSCYPSSPSDITMSISGTVIQINAILVCTILIPPPPPLTFTRNVGPLTQGLYQVQYLASFDGDSAALQATDTFQVEGVQPIPTLRSSLTISLLVAVAFAGLWRLRRNYATVLLLSIAGALCPLKPTEAAVSTSLEQLVSRQLIVLFDPSDPTSPDTDDALNAVVNPQQNPSLSMALGSPIDGTRLLGHLSASSSLHPTLAANPKSPRALLEQYVVLTYASSAAAAKAIDQLRRDQRVLSVESNRVVDYAITPNDAYFSFNPNLPNAGDFQWGMQLLNLPSAWNKSRGTAYISVIDNGIYCETNSPCVPHTDLQQNFRSQFSQNVSDSGSAADIDETLVNGSYRGHGTHVAGIIAATANNSAGVAGACWMCSLAIVKFGQTVSSAATALTFSVDHGFQAVNMSFTVSNFTSCTDSQYQSMCTAIAYAKERDVILVASSGNDYHNYLYFPAVSPDTIAVGGIQYGGYFWNTGYGLENNCPTPGTEGEECGSNYGAQSDQTSQVVAPALDVISTFYPGYSWSTPVHCADTWGPNTGALPSGYGDCTGTSMSAPHVTGIVGLARSINPLLTRDRIKSMTLSGTNSCVGNDTKCGAGIVDAAKIVTAALGSGSVKNWLTPLFSFYSKMASDHMYTVTPQMALAALNSGQLLPQPPTTIAYVPIGNPTPGYSQFPQPASCFSPCPSAAAPKAMVSIFTTHVDPTDATTILAPLYRMSWVCTGSCSHASHFYTTSSIGVSTYESLGYQLDGIEGYVYPPTKAQPFGTVKLCRKYTNSNNRDDYILFPGTGSGGGTCGNGDGFTDYGGDGIPDTVYTEMAGGTDWIGWVYPLRPPQSICAGGVPCSVVGVLPLIFADD